MRRSRHRVAASAAGRISALGLVLAILTAAAPPAVATGPVVNVSRRLGSQAEAAVAVNPRDAGAILVASNLDHGYGVFVATSQDRGATWRRTVLGDGDRFGHACCDPTVAWDRHGNAYLGWLGYEAGTLRHNVLTVVWSQDGGRTWRLFDRIDEASAGGRVAAGEPGVRVGAAAEEQERGGDIDQPTIVAARNALWAVWYRVGGRIEVAGARVRGPGDTSGFGLPRGVPGTARCTFGDLAVGPRGAIAQVCQRNVRGSVPRRSVLRVNVDPDGFGPRPFDAGQVVARTNVSLFESIRPQQVRTVDAEAGLAWDTAGSSPFRGRLYLLYTDEHPDQSDDTDLWLMRSNSGGRRWGDPRPVTDLPHSQFLPRLALDVRTGRLAVGFHDASLDDGLGGPYDTDGMENSDAMYSLVGSADGGRTWTAVHLVSEGPSNANAAANEVDFGDYTGLTFVRGSAYTAWADNSNTTGDNPDGTLAAFDVYLRRVRVP